MEPMTAGYSKRPLAQKLGIKSRQTIAVLNAPANYIELLTPLPEGVTLQFELSSNIPFIHFFCSKRAPLEANLPAMRQALTQNGMIWISWPKKAAKVPTDLDENIIRELGLANGLVDVKVAVIDLVWSGLKFVIRVKDRQASSI
ncbi:MAG: hypothetical protein U0175_33265 [Caldilineaceae bacterium]